MAKWKELADGNAEKIKGKWVGGAERQAILEKAESLGKEADALLKANQTLQAIKKLEEAAIVYPNSFETNFTLGYLAMVQHNDDKAIEWFTAALRVQPKSPEAMANLGVVQLSKKQYERGIVNIRKALDIQDRKEIVYNLLTAVSSVPPAVQKNKDVKEAAEAARLLASKYEITGPGKDYIIVPLRPQTAKGGGPGGKGNDSPTAMWSGTGFVISDDGLILTNRHVVEGGKTLMVVMPDRTQKSAEVVVIDDEQDLALVRIKPDAKLPFVKLATADAPADGAECTVIGYPLIDRLGAAVKITRGIVSSGSSGRKLSGPDVMVDAKVNPGNSGGPILDKHGNVMAIVSMKTRRLGHGRHLRPGHQRRPRQEVPVEEQDRLVRGQGRRRPAVRRRNRGQGQAGDGVHPGGEIGGGSGERRSGGVSPLRRVASRADRPQSSMAPTSIRPARREDASVLVDFNARMARETEGLDLDPAVLSRGVRAALADPAKAIYFVAEAAGEVVGQLMITHEWSDWRDGDIWWVQSVYVRPDHRRRGVFRSLYAHARDQARTAGAVGVRLYVDDHNAAAQECYRSLGMHVSNYRVMEEIFPRE